MRTRRMLSGLLLALTACSALAAHSADLGYDPQADPFEQYHQAIEAAAQSDKLVLLIAGGEWCGWCHALERFVARNPDVRESLTNAFVVVKIYVGDENFNRDFFEQLPEARGAPHFWIVSAQRRVLLSQSTGEFENGRRGYDKDRFLAFIERWRKAGRIAQVGPET